MEVGCTGQVHNNKARFAQSKVQESCLSKCVKAVAVNYENKGSLRKLLK